MDTHSLPKFSGFGQQSIYQVARELKKEQHTLYNCLASILSDAAFIQEIKLLYPDLPLLANLRAGGWYAPSPDGTCYFKSTDGHQYNWNFSVTRLNWHVAELAAQKGGVMVVDATRKGKRFPDAMSKTIPIWAAVLNRAVARVRAYDVQKAQRRRTYAAADGEVFTAVADTQTMISVRSEDGYALAAGSSCSTAALTGGCAGAVCTGAQFVHEEQQQQQAGQVEQQRSDHASLLIASAQEQRQTLEQPQGQQQHLLQHSARQQPYASMGACPASIGDSIQAASAVLGCNCSSDSSSSTQVVQLLVDCLGPSVDLMSGLGGADCSSGCVAPGPSAVPTPEPCSSSAQFAGGAAGAAIAAGTAGAGVGGCLGPPCCCMQRSKSALISPQPSLHEWLDEMDVLRRLTLMAETRAALRPAPRASCPSGRPEVAARAVRLPDCRAAVRAGSAPAVSCLLATAEEEAAPATPAAAACARAQFVEDVSVFAAAGACSIGRSRSPSPVAATGPQSAMAAAAAMVSEGPPSAPLPAVCKPAGPARKELGSPAFLLSTGHGAGLEAAGAGEPVTPRLMFGSPKTSSRSSSGEDMSLDPLQAGSGAAPGAVVKQLRFADHASEDSSEGGAPCEFAFPSQYQLAASVGSSVGAEAAGHLAASGMASSGSSCGSGLVRLPDMPVVVLNGTSHQPGDAASILDIWRGTDLEDVACLPGISDFRPGVYHMPRSRQRDISTDDDWHCEQQQQRQPASPKGLCPGDGSSISSGDRCAPSWAAEVCLRSQQLPGRVSVSNWLDDDETGAACEALCAFAVPALSPSCSAQLAEDTAASSNSAVCDGSQPSSSVCSEDSRPSSRQSSSTTAGFSSSIGLGGPLAESSSMGSGCLAATVEAAAALPVEWDTSLHLPLWVSSHEREAIEAKLDGWVERLLEVGADVRGLAAVLTKPLRPLWVSQCSLIWTNQVATPSSLPFTPLLLVSASQPHAGERQAIKSAWLSLARGVAGSPERPLATGFGAGLSDSDSVDDSNDDSDDDGVVLGCSWGSSSSRKASRHMLRGSRSQKQRKHVKAPSSKSRADAELCSWSYVYVPGAGDDEESWAAGLTPALFWQHCDALLRCGPQNIRPAVKQLLQLHKSASFGGAAASLAAAAVRSLAAAPASSSPGRALSPLGPCSGSVGTSGGIHGAGAMPGVATDRHHPAPQGCSTAGGAPSHVVLAAPGAFWVSNTGLAVGNLEAASVADVWRAFDAVLCCGTAMVPVLQGEYNAMRLAAARVPAMLSVAAVSSSAPAAASWLQQQQLRQSKADQQNRQAGGGEPISSSFCTSSSAAHAHWVRQQQQQAAADAADSAATGNQAQPALEFNRVGGAPARKPVRKGGMLSTLLSKAGASAAAACQSADLSGGVTSPAELPLAGSDASSVAGSEASSVCSSSYYNVCSEDGPSAGAVSYGAGCSNSALPRLKWLPVASAKKDRSSLKQHLQEALEFVSAHLAAGHTVLLHDVEGHDNCVCLAVAVLSGCFAPPEAAGNAKSGAAEPSFAGTWRPGSQPGEQSALQQQQQQRQCVPRLPAVPVSKQSVRQQLALVSGCYPLARPTRAMLKQVFNFFAERSHHN